MKRRTGFVVLGIVGAMFALMAVLPFILMTLPNPRPLPAKAPGSRGNGVYVQDATGAFQLYPRAETPSEWPKDAFGTTSDARVYIRSRQYDDVSAYGIYTFPDGKPLGVSKEMVAGRMLRLAPTVPLVPGRYIVQVSRDDAEGGSDYFCLAVAR